MHKNSGQPKKSGVSLRDLGYDSISVDLPGVGAVDFRYLTIKDVSGLGNLLATESNAREFSRLFLEQQLRSPKAQETKIEAWSESDLERAVRAFAAAAPSGFGIALSDSGDVFEEFRRSAQSFEQEHSDSLRRTMKSLDLNYAKQIKPKVDFTQELTTGLNAAVGLGISPGLLEDLVNPLAKTAISMMALNGLTDVKIAGVTANKAIDALRDQFSIATFNQIQDYSSTAAAAAAAISSGFTAALSSIPSAFDARSLIANLPSFTESFQRLRDAHDGAAALDEAGFTYAYSLFEIDFVVELSTVDPQNRVREVADRVKAATEEQEFKDEVEELFTESTLLSARWTAVQQGLATHQRGEYFASVATLLPQVEGVINDILTTLGATIRVDNKFYKKNADGTRGQELGGLASKKKVVESNTNLDTDLASFLTAYLIPQRNGILHGAEVAYGDAERSIHILLMLLGIAVTAASLETTTTNDSGVSQGS